MTESENEKTIEKMFEAWNRHDVEAFVSHFSDDMMAVMPGGHTVDKEEFRRIVAIEFSAFPDVISRVDRMVSQGDTVCVESTFTGTHKGAWFGIPATNKKVEFQEVEIYDFEAGKVKLWKLYFDRLRLLNQFNEQAVAELWDKMRK